MQRALRNTIHSSSIVTVCRGGDGEYIVDATLKFHLTNVAKLTPSTIHPSLALI